jgi:ATP-dependent DNA helicase RecQ
MKPEPDEISQAVDWVLDRRDAIFLLGQTLTGRSIYRELAARSRGTIVVLYSSLDAISETVSDLRQEHIQADVMHSNLTHEQKVSVESRFSDGALRLIGLPLETFFTQAYQKIATSQHIVAIAVDDAYLIADGYEVKSDGYKRLEALKGVFQSVPRLAITRSVGKIAEDRIVARLGLREGKIFASNVFRPNISYASEFRVGYVHEQATELLSDRLKGRGVVYAGSQTLAGHLGTSLMERGLPFVHWHTGIDEVQHHGAVSRLRSADSLIVIALVDSSRLPGDISLDFTLHLQVPSSIGRFLEETAIAGADGREAIALVMYGYKEATDTAKHLHKALKSESDRDAALSAFTDIFGFCTTIACRVQRLKALIGGSQAGRCGKCDNCRSPPETFDATEDAVMALACVHRVEEIGGSVGMTSLGSVLLGEQKESDKGRNFESLKVFGKGAHHKLTRWNSIYRQLYGAGYLSLDNKGFLTLTGAAHAVFQHKRTGERVILRLEDDKDFETRRQERLLKKMEPDDLVAQMILDALLRERKVIADGLNTREWFVFTDDFLIQMSRLRTVTLEQLVAIEGIRPMNAELYGPRMVRAVKAVVELLGSEPLCREKTAI